MQHLENRNFRTIYFATTQRFVYSTNETSEVRVLLHMDRKYFTLRQKQHVDKGVIILVTYRNIVLVLCVD